METRRFLGGLTSNIETQITERKKYSDFIEEKKAELGISFIDTVSVSKLYGFIDHDYHIVEPNPELVGFGEYAGNIVGQNFVVGIFNSFRDYYLERATNQGVSIPRFFPGLIAKASYEDISENYERYQVVVSQVMLEPFTVGRYADRDFTFAEFVEKLNEIIFDENKKNHKITKTGYVLSPYAKVYETGLYVDLAPQLDPSVDYVKVQIVSDESFQCFGEIANQFGFFIDQNCPWRLVLDLNSDNVRANILNYNFSRPFQEFYSSTYLIRTGQDDYWNLKSFYERLYIEYYNVMHPGIQLLTRGIDSYPEEKWIEAYLLNRLRELGFLKNPDFYSSDEEPTEQKRKFQNMLTECLERYRILNTELTHGSGVLKFIDMKCAEILKERIERFRNVRQQNNSIFVRREEL